MVGPAVGCVVQRWGRRRFRDGERTISKAALRRLARRAGVLRLSGGTYDTIRDALKAHLRGLVGDAVLYTEHAHRRTVTVRDVTYALKRRGHTLYGYGGDPPGHTQQQRKRTSRHEQPRAPEDSYELLEAFEEELRRSGDPGSRCLDEVFKYRITRTVVGPHSGNVGFQWDLLEEQGLGTEREDIDGKEKTVLLRRINGFEVDRSRCHRFLTSTKDRGWIQTKLKQLPIDQEMYLYVRFSGASLCGLLLFQKRKPSVFWSDYVNFNTQNHNMMLDLHLAMTSDGKKGGAAGLFRRARLDFPGWDWVLTIYERTRYDAVLGRQVFDDCMQRGMAAFDKLKFRHLQKADNYGTSGSGRTDGHMTFHMGLADSIGDYEPPPWGNGELPANAN